jgi:hypothetical protein
MEGPLDETWTDQHQRIDQWLQRGLLDFHSQTYFSPLPVDWWSRRGVHRTSSAHDATAAKKPKARVIQGSVGQVGRAACHTAPHTADDCLPGRWADGLSADDVCSVETTLQRGDDVSHETVSSILMGDAGPAALTVKQPWARALSWGVKDVENRGWVHSKSNQSRMQTHDA